MNGTEGRRKEPQLWLLGLPRGQGMIYDFFEEKCVFAGCVMWQSGLPVVDFLSLQGAKRRGNLCGRGRVYCRLLENSCYCAGRLPRRPAGPPRNDMRITGLHSKDDTERNQDA